MSLTVHADGSATLSKPRLALCLEIAWEMEALAHTLPTVTTNSDIEATRAAFTVRGLAGRFAGLAIALMEAVSEDAVTTERLACAVLVTPFEGESA